MPQLLEDPSSIAIELHQNLLEPLLLPEHVLLDRIPMIPMTKSPPH